MSGLGGRWDSNPRRACTLAGFQVKLIIRRRSTIRDTVGNLAVDFEVGDSSLAIKRVYGRQIRMSKRWHVKNKEHYFGRTGILVC
jgi:hypothetical protein